MNNRQNVSPYDTANVNYHDDSYGPSYDAYGYEIDPTTGQPNDVGYSWSAPYFVMGRGPSKPAPQSMAMCWNERGNGTTDAPCDTSRPLSCTADGTIVDHGIALLKVRVASPTAN